MRTLEGDSVFKTIKTLFTTRSNHQVLYECRHCGTTLDADSEQCPTCGTAEIARFVF